MVVLALAAVAWLWIWLGPEPTRQYRMLRSFVALFGTLLLLVVWFLALSRLPRRVRLAGLGLLVLAGVAAGSSLEIRGVTGDLLPVVSWRWAPGDAEVAAAAVRRAPGAGAPARDSPQFLGPDRDAVIRGVRLDGDWRARPPREVWRREIGAGWASFAVSGGLAVTQEQRADEELVAAYDLLSGEPRWTHADAVRYETVIAGVGPRATPAIANGRVYTLGATGILNALDLASGEKLWSRDVLRDGGSSSPEWGKSCSPLVVDGRVVVSAGGSRGRSLLAYDAGTGALAWSAGDDRSSYSSPLLAELAGVRQILIVNAASVAAHDPGTGEVLWEHPWSSRQPNVAQPLVIDSGRILLSKGYGHGSELWRISAAPERGFEVEVEWRSPRLKLKFTHAVLHGGRIYGLDDGVLVCLDPATGERCWKRGRYGHGQLLLIGDLLLIQAERGDLVLVEPDPGEHRELGRVAALDSKTWNVPAFAAPYLLVRNDREAAMYELALR